MTVEDAREGAGITKDGLIEIPELGVNRGQRGDRVSFAQHEQVLSAPGWIHDIDVHEPAVVERDEGNRGGECAAGVKAFVDRVPALFQAQKPDIGILDRQQLQDPLPEEVVLARRWRTHNTTQPLGHNRLSIILRAPT